MLIENNCSKNWACCTRCNEKRHDRVGSLELGTSDRT